MMTTSMPRQARSMPRHNPTGPPPTMHTDAERRVSTLLPPRILFANAGIEERAIGERLVIDPARLEQPVTVAPDELVRVVPEVDELHVLLGSVVGDLEPIGNRL